MFVIFEWHIYIYIFPLDRYEPYIKKQLNGAPVLPFVTKKHQLIVIINLTPCSEHNL